MNVRSWDFLSQTSAHEPLLIHVASEITRITDMLLQKNAIHISVNSNLLWGMIKSNEF